MILEKEISGILDVKNDCTIQELVGHINLLGTHFNWDSVTEQEVIDAIRILEDDETSDVVLVRARPNEWYPENEEIPWCVIHTRQTLKFVPLDCSNVPN